MKFLLLFSYTNNVLCFHQFVWFLIISIACSKGQNSFDSISRQAGCKLPEKPDNGLYNKILSVSQNQTDLVPSSTKLQFKCNEGFAITTQSESQCVDGYWTVKPTCERTKIMCYFLTHNVEGNFDPADVDANLCTHIILAFVYIQFDVIGTENPYNVAYVNGSDDLHNFVSVLKKKNPELKILNGLVGNSSQFSNAFNNVRNREGFANHTLRYLLDFGFDGLHLVWEYPGYFGGNPGDKDSYTELIKILSINFYKHNLTLSTLISGNSKIIETAYNIPEINKYLDIISIHSYELLEKRDMYTGICAPLYPYSYGHDNKFLSMNTDATFRSLLSLGASSHKLVLGVSIFGIMKNLTVHPGISECPPPSSEGVENMLYKYICALESRTSIGKYFFPEALAPVLALDTNWLTYENEESLKHKVKFVKSNNLGGISVFSLNMDDYEGICNKGRNPLLNSIYKSMRFTEADQASINQPIEPVSATTERTSSTMANRNDLQIGCTLPEYPYEGRYTVENYGQNLAPGDIVPPFTVLMYKCNRNYYPSSEYSYCENDFTWTTSPECYRKCRMPKSLSIDFTCWGPSGSQIVCSDRLDSGTVVKSNCKPYYRNVGSYFYDMTCQDGIFDLPTPKCEPDCGTEPSVGEPQIIEGQTAEIGTFPWHISVYQKIEENTPVFYDYICGGTIVKAQIVLSAAHCFYSSELKGSFPPSLYAIAAGKLSIDWVIYAKIEPYVQTSEVKNIFIPSEYRGIAANHHADLAILELLTPLQFSEVVHPACINLNDDNLDKTQLRSGNYGKVAGWGFTSEAGGVSQELRYLNVPKISYEQCFNGTLHFNFAKYLTLDKFCGGYTNGSSVCKGDSGGGLVFPYRDFFDSVDRWYVRGIVSVTPARNQPGPQSCIKDTYAAYTHVFSWRIWLSKLFNELKV